MAQLKMAGAGVKKFMAEQAFLRCLADSVDPAGESADQYLDLPMFSTSGNRLLAAAIRSGKVQLSRQSIANILTNAYAEEQLDVLPVSFTMGLADLIEQNLKIPALWYIQGSDADVFHNAIYQGLLDVASDDARLAGVVDTLREHKADVDECLDEYPITSRAIGRKK